jgi:hypothetical protein
MSEKEIKQEMFELSNNKKVMGVRLNYKSKIGFDCFLYKPLKTNEDYLDDRYVLYDEMSGKPLCYVQQDLDVSLEKLGVFIKRKTEYENIINIHNKMVSDGVILPKFAKDIKIILQFDSKNIQFPKTEYLQDFVEFSELNNYFENIYCHQTGNNQNDYLQNNTCYIFCGGLLGPKGLKHEEKRVYLDEDLIPFVDVFDYMPIRYKGVTSRDILFYTVYAGKKYILGNYIYDMNTLALSDISHGNDFQWVKEFIDYLKNNILTKNKENHSNKIILTIGADPEFELHVNNRNVCGTELQTGNRLRTKIGCDGSGRQMEFRPDPKKTPEDATNEILSIIDSISYHTVRCDGDQEPLGGHIHFGITRNGIAGKIRYNADMIKALDMFLGKHVKQFSGKARSGYGALSDARDQPWGFEYRTPPSAIFFTKEMSYICYKIAYNIVDYLIKNKTMSISISPSYEDYSTYAGLTKKEYNYFINFGDIYNKETKQKSITDNWVSKKPNPLKIIFYDTWSNEIKEKYNKELINSVTTKPVTICLYGIKEERGVKAVSGLNRVATNFTCDLIAHPKDSHCEEGIAIGFGKWFRNNYDNSFSYICNEIKNKIGIANASMEPITTINLFPEEMLNKSKKPNNINGRIYAEEVYEIRNSQEDEL